MLVFANYYKMSNDTDNFVTFFYKSWVVDKFLMILILLASFY